MEKSAYPLPVEAMFPAGAVKAEVAPRECEAVAGTSEEGPRGRSAVGG